MGSTKYTFALKLFKISISKDTSSPTPADKSVGFFGNLVSEKYHPPYGVPKYLVGKSTSISMQILWNIFLISLKRNLLISLF